MCSSGAFHGWLAACPVGRMDDEVGGDQEFEVIQSTRRVKPGRNPLQQTIEGPRAGQRPL
jgi:hypothetical protein